MYPLMTPPVSLRRAQLPVAPDPLTTCATLALGPAARAGHLCGDIDVAAQVGLRGEVSVPQLDAAERILQEAVESMHRSPQAPVIHLTFDVEPHESTLVTTARLAESTLSAQQLHTLYAAYFADVPGIEVLPVDMPAVPVAPGGPPAQLAIRADEDALEIACALDLPVRDREPPASLSRPDA